jgi:hypothetical protein
VVNKNWKLSEFLDNREWLIEQRKLMSREQLATKLNCNAGSIAWRERLLTPQEREGFVFERLHKKSESKESEL